VEVPFERFHVLRLVGSAEASSEHPLGQAIVQYARHCLTAPTSQNNSPMAKKEMNEPEAMEGPSATPDLSSAPNPDADLTWMLSVSEFESVPGCGIRCRVGGHLLLVRKEHQGAKSRMKIEEQKWQKEWTHYYYL
jgi:Cu+-exporting ATPase